MQVTEQQAFVIARALYKGIQQQEKGENKFYFSVWRDGAANIGIKKRRRQRYAIFVDFNGREDKSIRLPFFDRNIDLEELSQMVQQAIEESVVLQDKDLDTSREIFRNLPEEPKSSPAPQEEDEDEDEFDDDINNSETMEESDDEDDESDDDDDDEFEEENDDDEEFEFEEITDDNSDVVDKNGDPILEDFDELDPDSDKDPFEEIAPEPKVVNASGSNNQGFDIGYYLCNTNVGGTIMDKSERLAKKIAGYVGEDGRVLKGTTRHVFVNFIDAMIRGNMFTSMTNEECTMRYDNFYMKDVFDFLMNNDIPDIDKKFGSLPKNHLALVPYKVFAMAKPDIKSHVMQNAVLKLADYANDDFNNIFNDIVEEINAADEHAQQIIEEDTTKETEEMNENYDELIGNTDLVDENGEPNAYSALAPTDNEESAVSTEVRSMSLLQGQINERADEFAAGMNNVFLEIVKSNPDQAEILYFIAMEIALEAYKGDAKALAAAIKSDSRDIIMADYEFKTRIQAKDLNDLKNR